MSQLIIAVFIYTVYTSFISYSYLMYPTCTYHCNVYHFVHIHIYTQHTCKSRQAHLRFGSLCCLRRSSCPNHWKDWELWVFALRLLWKKTTVKSTLTLKKNIQKVNAYEYTVCVSCPEVLLSRRHPHLLCDQAPCW